MAEREKKTKFKKFLDENRSLVFTVPVFLVLIVVVILVYALSGNNDVSETTPPEADTNQPAATQSAAPVQTESPATDSGQEVTTLPDDERDKDQNEILRNPFAEPYRVSGIIYDKSGSIAIIEAENKSFIVEAGDEPGGYFKVLSIEEDKVVLEVEGIELILSISGE
ncbi:MAG: hypothetical protein JW903_05885 [Clostridia bacterium]|nr:hypothetical protein [Clostridia bacterium]